MGISKCSLFSHFFPHSCLLLMRRPAHRTTQNIKDAVFHQAWMNYLSKTVHTAVSAHTIAILLSLCQARTHTHTSLWGATQKQVL